MYRIISTTTGANLGIVDKVLYIKIGQSGDFCPATEEEAVGVALNSHAYNLLGHSEIERADTVLISGYDGGQLVQAEQRNSANIDYLSMMAGIDLPEQEDGHEYESEI